jgi:hypothetical protein
MRPGVVVEKKAASRIRAAANGSSGAFDEKLGGGTGDRGEEPLESTFPGNELQRPGAFAEYQFVMSFGDAQDFVHGLRPGRRERLFVHNRGEDGAETLAKAEGAEEDGIDGSGLRGEKRAKTRGTVLRDQPSVDEESDKLIPG